MKQERLWTKQQNNKKKGRGRNAMRFVPGLRRLTFKRQIFGGRRIGQPLAAVPPYGCCIPPAGKGRVRENARRRVSEGTRRKAAALSQKINREGRLHDSH